ncbi:hypothetical protein ACIQ7Q_30935 [Streptomyces sp. NPDC096176]|uniref:hypothetical protein n=1 Tax=Streptomyces sp. NPDC096176 TaxID=3366079 RepID=UPI00381A12ED
MSERDDQDADSGIGDEAAASRARPLAAAGAECDGRDIRGARADSGSATGELPAGTGHDGNGGADESDGTGESSGAGDAAGTGAGSAADHGDADRDTGRGGAEPPADDAQQRPSPELGRPTPSAGSSESALVQTGRAVTAALTVLAALGGLVLGIRAELRTTEEAEQVDAKMVSFYRTPTMITVLNGSNRVIAMRLSLEQPSVWWDLQAVPPCQKIDIPPALLEMSMSEAVPRVTVNDVDLDRLRLEFMDSEGRTWIRAGGGPLRRSAGWEQSLTSVRMVSPEPWNAKPEEAPGCGA